MQTVVQWVSTHLRGVVLALTLSTSLFTLIRSPQMTVGPVRWALLYVVTTGQRVFRVPIHLAALEEQNRYLRNRLLMKVIRETELSELRLENDRLRDMLEFQRSSGMELLAASTLSHDSDIPPTSIIIDVGRTSGIQPFLPVISPQGLVGRIERDPSDYRSVVRLLTDPGLRTSVVIANRNRAMGILRWDGSNVCIEHVPQESRIVLGDPVITSGKGGIFPAGLFVGRIDSVRDDPHALFKSVTVKPAAKLDRLEEVFVVHVISDSTGTTARREASDALDR
jgi:rod shape-determining protein MreC